MRQPLTCLIRQETGRPVFSFLYSCLVIKEGACPYDMTAYMFFKPFLADNAVAVKSKSVKFDRLQNEKLDLNLALQREANYNIYLVGGVSEIHQRLQQEECS